MTMHNNDNTTESRNHVNDLREYANTRRVDFRDLENEAVSPPYLPDDIFKELPPVIRQLTDSASAKAERDVFLLGSLVCLSAAFPNVYGKYDGRTVYPNLYLFVTSQAGMGKGSLGFCRELVMPIHRHLREIAIQEEKGYRQACKDRKKDETEEMLNEPPMRMFMIPANSSAAAFQKILADNEGVGLLFETEGDTLSQIWEKDYGQYSDMLRKAFHHEMITSSRKTNREYLEIDEPKVSTVLSGTPKQVSRLIPDEEDGLMSRFIYYCIPPSLTTRNVFAVRESGKETLFKNAGCKLYEQIAGFRKFGNYQFDIRDDDKGIFLAIISEMTNECAEISYTLVGTARRMGLIGFRIMMMLSILRELSERHRDECSFDGKDFRITCNEYDFIIGVMMMRTLLQHSIHIFGQISSLSRNKKTPKNRDLVYEQLPPSFSKGEYDDIVVRMGLNVRTSEAWIDKFIMEGRLERTAQGAYKKK